MSDMYYSCEPVIKIAEDKKCPTIVIAGGKGNGKTYSVLLKYLKVFIDNGRILRYVRRYRESIAPKAIQSLLKPQRQNLINLTRGKYNDFMYYQNRFYLIRVDDDGNRVDKLKQPFMVCNALNSVESFTGADEGACSAVFFDEFLSREKQLEDEFTTLMILHDNCIRNRTDYYTPLLLVGNTVSRNSTLAKDFGIDLYRIKKGEITCLYNSRKEITSVVDYCDTIESMRIAGDTYYSRYNNDRVKMMYTGDWSIGNYPRLQHRYIDASNLIYSIRLNAPVNTLTVEIRQYKNMLFGYCRPSQKSDNCICTVTTAITPTHNDVINYFSSRIRLFLIWGRLMLQKQFYFADGQTGEMYRDFLYNLNGAEQFKSLYK